MYAFLYVCEIPNVCLYSEQSACPMYEVFQLCTTPITTWQGVFSWQPQIPEAWNPNLALLVMWLSTDPKHWCLPSLCRRMSMKDQVEFSSCLTFSTGNDRCYVCMYVCIMKYLLMMFSDCFLYTSVNIVFISIHTSIHIHTYTKT